MLESRTDWVALQLVLIYFETTGDESKKAVKNYVKLARNVKNYLKKSTEKMSDQAYAEGDLKVCDVAEEVCNFYHILPPDIFMRKPSTFVAEDESDYGDEIVTPIQSIKKEKKQPKPKKARKESLIPDPTPKPKQQAKKRGRPAAVEESSSKHPQESAQGKRSKSARPAQRQAKKNPKHLTVQP